MQQLDSRLANDASNDTTTAQQAQKKAVVKGVKFQVKNADKETVAQKSNAQMEAAKKQHPLLAMLQPTGQNSLALVGYASVRDTAAIDKLIYGQTAKQVLPSDIKLLWSATPEDGIKAKNIFGLYAIKVTSNNGQAPLQGDVVVDAKDEFNHVTGQPEVNMTMNTEGARRWAALTIL